MDEPIVFQATKRYRRQYLLTWLRSLFFAMFFGFIILPQDSSLFAKSFSISIILGAMFLGVRASWISPKKLEIQLSEGHLQGFNGTNHFQMLYTDIFHIKNIGHALQINATEGQFLLEKQHFSIEEIQLELKVRLRPDAFVEEGWLNLPAYQKLLEQQETRFATISSQLPIRVYLGLSILQRVGLVLSIVFFISLALFSWAPLKVGSIFFLSFAGLSVIVLFRKGELEIDDRGISYQTKSQKYYIPWANISRVEYDDSFSFVFYGQDQRLKIPALNELVGEQKEDFYFYLHYLIKQKNLEPEKSQWTLFRLNKNTKVPK